MLQAFDVAEKELGITPVMTGVDMAACEVPDKLTLVSYLSQFYEFFRKESIPILPPTKGESIKAFFDTLVMTGCGGRISRARALHVGDRLFGSQLSQSYIIDICHFLAWCSVF